MNVVRPFELRDMKISRVQMNGDGYVTLILENGGSHKIQLAVLISDWLFLHKKLQLTKQWAEDRAAEGVT